MHTTRGIAKARGAGLAVAGDPAPQAVGGLAAATSGVDRGMVSLSWKVPATVKAGRVSGQLTVNGTAGKITLPLEVEIVDVVVPDKPTFNCEMNGYGYPDQLATFNALQTTARRFRSHVNLLPYSHTGRTRLDMVMLDGKRTSEAAYNKIMGCRGVLPWNRVVQGDKYLKGELSGSGQQYALFIVVSDKNPARVVPTLRLAAFREGALLAEYLELLRRRKKATQGQMERLIRSYLSMDAVFSISGTYTEDAGERQCSRAPVCCVSFTRPRPVLLQGQGGQMIAYVTGSGANS